MSDAEDRPISAARQPEDAAEASLRPQTLADFTGQKASREKAHNGEEQDNQGAPLRRLVVRLDRRFHDLNDGRVLGFVQLGCVVLLHQHIEEGLLILQFVCGAKVFQPRGRNIT